MMTIFCLFSSTLMSFFFYPLNPIKFSFLLILLSVSMFIMMFFLNSSIWMSSIFFMIFIGGIMIMFLLFCSLLPNEKNLKMKSLIFSMIIFNFINFFLFSKSGQVESKATQETKITFFSNQSFEVLMLVILLYFLSFVYIVSKENSSLRTFLCYKKKDFVILKKT